MAAFAVVRNIYDVAFDAGAGELTLKMNVFVINYVTAAASVMEISVLGNFMADDWPTITKEAIRVEVLAELGEDIEWVLLPSISKF